jgi:hypothetical protein
VEADERAKGVTAHALRPTTQSNTYRGRRLLQCLVRPRIGS